MCNTMRLNEIDTQKMCFVVGSSLVINVKVVRYLLPNPCTVDL